MRIWTLKSCTEDKLLGNSETLAQHTGKGDTGDGYGDEGSNSNSQEGACHWYAELVIAVLNVNEQCFYARNTQKMIILKHTLFYLKTRRLTCVIKISVGLWENINHVKIFTK